jgi:hypothetical protein
MRACIVVNANEFQIDIGLPIEGDINVARKYSPRCSVVKFNNVAFRVSANFHSCVSCRHDVNTRKKGPSAEGRPLGPFVVCIGLGTNTRD